ncbi:flavin reductase [Cupriavidus necator]
MSLLSAAVNVITTDGPGGRYGLTASAVCSVTDSPPTVLVCINQKSATLPALMKNRVACVNILPGDREDVAREFAGMTLVPQAERFRSEAWEEGRLGVPVLREALSSLEGRIADIKTVGCHTVLFLEIATLQLRGDGDGLAYFGRNFHRMSRCMPVPATSR